MHSTSVKLSNIFADGLGVFLRNILTIKLGNPKKIGLFQNVFPILVHFISYILKYTMMPVIYLRVSQSDLPALNPVPKPKLQRKQVIKLLQLSSKNTGIFLLQPSSKFISHTVSYNIYEAHNCFNAAHINSLKKRTRRHLRAVFCFQAI